MAERRNGSYPYGNGNKRHGSDQRGVAAIPRGATSLDALKQSQVDRLRLKEMARRHREKSLGEGFGNRELPAFKHKQEIIDSVNRYKAVVLGGETGSGKSTQTPQYLLEADYDKIYMLVPRRVIADGLHDRLIDELGVHLGDEASSLVGVVHGERTRLCDDNKIVVMTPNTFIKMESDIRAQHYENRVAIISDEIHEANLYTDLATGVAATAVADCEDWRLIVSSATHNTGSVQNLISELNGGFVPSIEIEGRPFLIDFDEMKQSTPAEAYYKLHQSHDKAMIFTSGKEEINHVIASIEKIFSSSTDKSSSNLVFRKLHGDLSDIEISHLNDPVPEGSKLVIVSSPAGMSGITIPGVTLVITDGTINRSELDSDSASGLRRSYMSRAEIKQQIGRAGRDVPGGQGVLTKPTAVFEDRLRARGKAVDQEMMPFVGFDDKLREDFSPAEIYHSNLSQVALSVATLDRSFVDINKFLPNQVMLSQIVQAQEVLARLGALDDDDLITTIGRQMDDFPIRPELSRGVVEVINQHRTLQQMVRVAFVAAALESGGLQDYARDASEDWRDLLRLDTKDDAMAQLDIMMSDMPVGEVEFTKYVEDYGLSYKRVKRARKVARKIMQKLGVDINNVVLTPPNQDESIELINDMTAGMIDLVYEKTRSIKDKQYYRNIHGDTNSTQRYIGRNSIMGETRERYLAGFPRWFYKISNGREQKHDVIEMLMPVDPVVVGEHAKNNKLLTRSGTGAYIQGGRVVETYQPKFGSIPVGGVEADVLHDTIPQKSQTILVEHVLKSPGPAQLALRELAAEINTYQSRLPEGEFEKYLRKDAPEIITSSSIRDLIAAAAQTTRKAHEVDQLLANYIFHENINMQRFIGSEARQELKLRTPGIVDIGGETLPLHYDGAVPYIIGSSQRVRKLVAGKNLHLPDGREILVQVSKDDGGKKRVSTHELDV